MKVFIKETDQKKFYVLEKDGEEIDIELISSSVTNKFNIIVDFIEKLSTYFGESFDEWFFNFIKECYENKENKEKIVSENVNIIKNYCDEYVEKSGLDFSKFVNRSKVKKNSILFLGEEIKEIIKASSYLKIYSFISNNKDLKLGISSHRLIYNNFIDNILKTEIVNKIYTVVKTKTYRYNISDRFMWEYIKNIYCRDIWVHIIDIFNFIMNNILVICEVDKNPITYFVGVVDESIRWVLRSIYKDTIVYDDNISKETFQTVSTGNYKSLIYNDTISRLKAISFEKTYEIFEKRTTVSANIDDFDKKTEELQRRIMSVEFRSPICEYLAFPILSNILDIPYYYFDNISPEHSILVSVYLKNVMEKIFKNQFDNLVSLMEYYPTTRPSLTATTYKIKSISSFLKKQQSSNFFGFKTRAVPHNYICFYVGKITRLNLCNLITGNRMDSLPLTKIEQDIIDFFTYFFGGRLDEKLEECKNVILSNF